MWRYKITNKYRNVWTEYNGIRYQSKKEAKRAQELDLLKKAKKVKTIVRQPKFEIEINGQHICNYKADFKIIYSDDRIEYEDVKGIKTEIYKLKKKLVEVLYNIEIIEI